ncbi:MAG TPA: carboxypeptidase-like regulatory domain-containing protein [Cyclobacteriaceae bacterium]|nr:carboxypeptidase-like regulatory domain-containing protein [Cyclobacteriaceae bacterium]
MSANTVTRLIVLAQLLTVAGYAQTFETIKGIVADSATHRPIQFVNVVIKNTNRGVATDEKGYFALQASPTDTLLFSYVGYKTLEFSLVDWEPSVILMPEQIRMLNPVIVKDAPLADPYEHLFDEENIRLKNSQKTIPFYYPRDKKEKIKIERAKKEAVRVKHYVDLMVKDDKVKNYLMKKHKLNEDEYYAILTRFNEKNYAIMYYLTDSELLSLLYRFYEAESDVGD